MSQFRGVILTENNPEDWKASLKEFWDTGRFRYVVGQLEKGEQGTEHLQAYLNGYNAMTLAGLRKINARAHYEPVKKDNGAAAYCMKEETRIEGPLEFGTRPLTQKESSKKAIEARKEQNMKILEVGVKVALEEGLIRLDQYDRVRKNISLYQLDSKLLVAADDVRGVWIYGSPGVGKSHKARVDYPGAYIKAQNKWWDGYSGEENVILDDMDCKELGHYMKIWMDKWECTGEIKGGIIPLMHKKFVVTSNYSIEELFVEPVLVEAIKRRCKVIHIVKLSPPN